MKSNLFTNPEGAEKALELKGAADKFQKELVDALGVAKTGHSPDHDNDNSGPSSAAA